MLLSVTGKLASTTVGKVYKNELKHIVGTTAFINRFNMFPSLDESENSKLLQYLVSWFSVSEVGCCLNVTNFKTPVLTETDAYQLPGSEIIDRTSVSK